MILTIETRLRLVLLAVLGLLLMQVGPAGAATASPEPVVGVDWFDFANPANFVLMLGFVIPVVTAAVTKKVASSEVKSLVTLLLTTITAASATLVGLDGEWAWREFGNSFLSTFLPAIASYYGFWKHSAVTRTVTEKTADFGVLGKQRTLENSTRPDGPDPADGALLASSGNVNPVAGYTTVTQPPRQSLEHVVDAGETNAVEYGPDGNR